MASSMRGTARGRSADRCAKSATEVCRHEASPCQSHHRPHLLTGITRVCSDAIGLRKIIQKGHKQLEYRGLLRLIGAQVGQLLCVVGQRS